MVLAADVRNQNKDRGQHQIEDALWIFPNCKAPDAHRDDAGRRQQGLKDHEAFFGMAVAVCVQG